MSKRKYESKFFEQPSKRFTGEIKKHTLDSDEEDNVDEDNVLDDNDIEGEEEGIARQDGEQRMTAFNMTEEMEEGHFDKDGHFIWKNEKEIRDNWLDNIDWQKIQHNAEFANKYDINERGLGESDSESDDDTKDFNEIETYKAMLAYMKPKETINKAIKRLGRDTIKLSSVERLKRKKAGTLTENNDVTKLTELANLVLTKTGNMDIYQETYEQLQSTIDKKGMFNNKSSTAVELDMYSDDFDVKEHKKIVGESSTSAEFESKPVLMWEFKWKADDEKIEGPCTTKQMIKWKEDKYFTAGVMVRKCGETSNFYSLSRIDFELYE